MRRQIGMRHKQTGMILDAKILECVNKNNGITIAIPCESVVKMYNLLESFTLPQMSNYKHYTKEEIYDGEEFETVWEVE